MLVRKLPWLSASLLLIAYAIFSKLIITTSHLWSSIISAAILGVFLALMLMSPLTNSEKILTKWFRSDTIAFLSLLMLAAFASILLNWFKIFIPVIMVLCAEALVRIDLQTAEFSYFSSLAVLIIVTWMGLGLGWVMAMYM
ncbi:hypothetical protein NIES2135_47510 [Leptolyngbya boryana NIES-2135]|jgi:hypothetical protein|uniref:Uncharacterized protein n=1 Tax=Leptolyngbya boryana NIES-2135 TaxID=1973484 RepID=A0A1Z4JME8_LEPBY|nr:MULTISPECIES: hypothetical protein [Leptolyngbya]BAY57880.1 hypothetical protein NIES2135_47510 [Leptolyngbya boryana NIES-2135]MBD2367325.1 hypothetical protein [Leptolyngbya sp. FACHB-161]MBD2373850.1 hypothetical protein [Leptolyngbya sp. FACHB-238]MBD2398351.1 hypothetical protein [Leptolyngbya sp. FACHB-239]MBD2404152.1 hypothetical protein [Leptolyngbya sp. FACHB-402]